MTALIPPALTVHPTASYAEPTPLPLVRFAVVSKPSGHEVTGSADDSARVELGSSWPKRRRWLHALLRH